MNIIIYILGLSERIPGYFDNYYLVFSYHIGKNYSAFMDRGAHIVHSVSFLLLLALIHYYLFYLQINSTNSCIR